MVLESLLASFRMNRLIRTAYIPVVVTPAAIVGSAVAGCGEEETETERILKDRCQEDYGGGCENFPGTYEVVATNCEGNLSGLRRISLATFPDNSCNLDMVVQIAQGSGTGLFCSFGGEGKNFAQGNTFSGPSEGSCMWGAGYNFAPDAYFFTKCGTALFLDINDFHGSCSVKAEYASPVPLPDTCCFREPNPSH
jgi:hypothetical protein